MLNIDTNKNISITRGDKAIIDVQVPLDKNLISGRYYEGYLNNNQSVMKTDNNIYNNYSSSYYLSQDYWLGKDSFHINDDGTRYKYKAGRTYKWIAIWK